MKVIRIPLILNNSEKLELNELINKLCLDGKLSKKDDKRYNKLLDMMIQAERDRVFSALQTKLNSESVEKINERILAIDNSYKNSLNSMSWETKRELILDVEFNYIQQCSLKDLKTVFNI